VIATRPSAAGGGANGAGNSTRGVIRTLFTPFLVPAEIALILLLLVAILLFVAGIDSIELHWRWRMLDLYTGALPSIHLRELSV
jgi:hypothetical protein